VLLGLLLLVPTAFSVSAQADEVAGASMSAPTTPTHEMDEPSLSNPLIDHSQLVGADIPLSHRYARPRGKIRRTVIVSAS